jgi:hypothetical protein
LKREKDNQNARQTAALSVMFSECGKKGAHKNTDLCVPQSGHLQPEGKTIIAAIAILLRPFESN